MEIEWDNPGVWGITIVATLIIVISIWKFGDSIGWGDMPLLTRILISVLTPPVAFGVATLVNNK